MAEPQLVDYIKKAKKAGQTDDQTCSLLYKNGWTEAEVADAFAVVNQPQPQMPIEPQQAQPNMQPVQSQPQPQSQPKMQYQTHDPKGTPQSSMPKSKKGLHLALKIIVALVVLVVACAAVIFVATQTDLIKNLLEKPTISQVETKGDENQNPQPAVEGFKQPSFAQYNLESTKYTATIPEYKISLSELTNLNNFQTAQKFNFSVEQKDALTTDNFVIIKNNDKFYSADLTATGRNDDWTSLYGKIGGPYADYERSPENSVFITTDFLAHTYHKLIDEEFSYIEEANFYPTLDQLSKSLLKQSADAYAAAADQKQKDSYNRLSAYFLVTSAILDNALPDYEKFKTQNYIDDTKADSKSGVLLKADSLAKDNNVSDEARDIAKQEIGLIFDAKGMASSPLLGKYQGPGMFEDYTQFAPRSHYTKNVILRDYFRAMMFYGRMNFLLKSPELTRDAANISLLLSPDQLKQWESIYLPTAFFVGKADDLSIYEYNQAGNKTKYKDSDKSDSSVTSLQNELITYKNPQIMSSVIIGDSVGSTTKEDLQNTTKGFRFMGQRFTPDAFIFSTLTQGNELPDAKTGQSLPSLPTALMVSTLMGSKESASLFDTWIKDNAPNSDKVLADRMSTLSDYFGKTTSQQWTQNIYWSWLYTIKSLFTDSINKTGYPMFVKSKNWDKKSLQGFLGSWTELKHDTLLYAKQSYAEMGGAGGEEPPPAKPVPKGYVEPNIEFFDRLISLVNLTNDGLKQFGILPSNLESRNQTFKEAVQFYRTIAVSELANQTISDDDFEKLRLSAGQLDSILRAPDSDLSLESNARSAIIADVHTSVPDNKILYEADGIPNYIYVAVKDANGTRLTKGLVYSYYEFTGPIGKRYTDQTWQSWEYAPSPQKLQMPWWNRDLVR